MRTSVGFHGLAAVTWTSATGIAVAIWQACNEAMRAAPLNA